MALTEEILTSRQNPLVALAVRLDDRKRRVEEELYRFDGIKLLSEALKNGVPLETVLLRASDAARVRTHLGAGLPCRCVLLADSLFDRVSGEAAPEGVLTIARFQPALHRELRDGDTPAYDSGERLLLLESVRDPSNLGAIVRSAAAFGVDRVILSADCADLYSAKTVRASMGTLFSQPTDRVSALPPRIAALRAAGRRVYAAALDAGALRLGEFPVSRGDCVVIGNEGHGLSPQTVAACDAPVYIPMTDRAESLNAACAATVLLWAFRTPR